MSGATAPRSSFTARSSRARHSVNTLEQMHNWPKRSARLDNGRVVFCGCLVIIRSMRPMIDAVGGLLERP